MSSNCTLCHSEDRDSTTAQVSGHDYVYSTPQPTSSCLLKSSQCTRVPCACLSYTLLSRVTRPILSVAMVTCTARYTHQSLVDEVLSGVDNKQGNHVPQERLGGWGGGAHTLGASTCKRCRMGARGEGVEGKGALTGMRRIWCQNFLPTLRNTSVIKGVQSVRILRL